MSSYVVTGANGFVGAAVVRELIKRGHNVRVVLRRGADTSRLRDVLSKLETIQGGFDCLDDVRRSLKSRKADGFVHAAWAGVGATEREQSSQMTINIPGTLKICELAAQMGCETFLGIGSQAEYGRPEGILDENSRLNPHSVYGFAKYIAGISCQRLSEMMGMRFLWLRLLSAYGPGDDDAHLIPTVIRSLLEGVSPELTHGTQKWDYLYSDDVGAAIASALESSAHGTFLLGSGNTTTIRQVVEMIHAKVNPAVPLKFGYISDNPSTFNLEADIRPFTRATGWSPKVSLDRGLDLTIDSISRDAKFASSEQL